jgi:CHC2 zinc finger
MNIVHPNARPLNPETDRGRERYGFRKGLGVMNVAVPLPTYAATVTELKTAGLRLVGSCPNPNHEDDTPSFTVYTESSRWYCFGCSRGGDLLDLFMLVEDWPEDAYGPALAAMAQKFDVELPQRPPRWFDWQDEKGRVRETAKRYIADRYQRRLTRVFAPLVLLGGETPEEELEALEELASALWPISLSLAGRRVAGEE